MKKIVYILTTLCLTIASANAQTYIIENFNYGTNDSLLNNGWVLANSTVNPLRANATGLTYSGYSGSGIGSAVPMANNGQDIVKDASTALSSGSVYSSFLMNVSAAQAAGDYFYGLVVPASTTVFFARTFIKSATTTGYYFMGVSKAAVGTAETAVYSTDSFAYSTTYLCVIKYQFNTSSTTDDSIKVFMFSSGIPSTEPVTAKAATIGGTNTDATSLGRVLLRQGSASNAPTLTIDAIRFGTSWGNVALPVQFTSFNANKSTNSVVLNWNTASEQNNDRFVIEKSNDNQNFNPIGEIIGAGNTALSHSYSFTDMNLLNGSSYYRLKQIDFDGNINYSKIVTVTNIVSKNINNLLPNPFSNELNVYISSTANTQANVELIDMLGRVHYTGIEILSTGDNKVTINTQHLTDGIYFVRVNINGEISTQKIIKR